MNDELNNQLAEIIKKAITVAEKTGEFAIEQAPDLLREFYMWHLMESILGVILGIVILLISRYIPYIWLDKENRDGLYDYDFRYFKRYGNDGGIIAYTLFGVGGILGVSVFCINIYKVVFITVAPKLYLIDYFIR